MTLTNLKTVKKTVLVTSVKLTTAADRIGLGFGAGQANAYPADSSLSQGRFPTPHNPEPEQLRSRQEQSAAQMRKQTRTDGTDVPDAVPPASSAGRVLGSSADRVSWRVPAIDLGRSCPPLAGVVRDRIGSDCQSPDRCDDKRNLARKTAPASAAGK